MRWRHPSQGRWRRVIVAHDQPVEVDARERGERRRGGLFKTETRGAEGAAEEPAPSRVIGARPTLHEGEKRGDSGAGGDDDDPRAHEDGSERDLAGRGLRGQLLAWREGTKAELGRAASSPANRFWAQPGHWRGGRRRD